MNTIYVKTKRGQRKVKSFLQGLEEEAIQYGWKVAYKRPQEEFFIITEDKKCLRFNKQIIL